MEQKVDALALEVDITDRLRDRLERLGELIGEPLGDDYADAAAAAAERYAERLAGGDRAAAGVMTDLVDVDDTKDALSPLGQAVAEILMAEDLITQAQAAKILDVGRGQVFNLIRDGVLEVVPSRGKRMVTRGSVMRRLAEARRRRA